MSRRPIRLDHGRRQPAEFSPLAAMARYRPACADRGGGPSRSEPLRRFERRRPSLAALPRPRTRRARHAAANGARLGFPARSQIAAVVDGAALAARCAARVGSALNGRASHSFLMELGFFPAPETASGWRSTAAIVTFSVAPLRFGA